MPDKVCKSFLEIVRLLTIKAGVFTKMSHSVWQSSLIMSSPDDRVSVKAADNGKYVSWWEGGTSVWVAHGSAETLYRKILMRLFSPPRHNHLRWEGRCEAMAESITILLYPSGLQFTGSASSSFTSLVTLSSKGGWRDLWWRTHTRTRTRTHTHTHTHFTG